jgi:hypothetical protein
MLKVAYIGRLSDGRYRVYSEDGKNLGTYSSKDKAKKRLQQVEMFKHMDKNKKKNRKKSFLDIFNSLNKKAEDDAIEQTATKTYSMMMRELNKKDPEKLKEFMASFKRAFDDAIKNDIEYPEQVALLEAIQSIEDPSAN